MIGTPVASHRISLHPAALTSKKPNPQPLNPAIVLFIKYIFTEPWQLVSTVTCPPDRSVTSGSICSSLRQAEVNRQATNPPTRLEVTDSTDNPKKRWVRTMARPRTEGCLAYEDVEPLAPYCLRLPLLP
jgi:hypothetical protein